MRRTSSAVSIAVLIALVFNTVSPQAQAQNIALNVDGMAPGQQIEFALNAGNIGKTATSTANAQGSATSVFDFANEAKPQVLVDVYTFTCPTPPSPPKVVVKMVPQGSPAPDDPCGNRKLIGAFWLNRARGITIHLGTGTMDVNYGNQIVKWGLIGGGAAIIGVIAVAAGGDSSTSTGTTPSTTSSTAAATTSSSTTSSSTTSSSTTSSTTSSTSTSSTTTTTTTGSQTPFTSLNGTYVKVATRTTNTCNFFVANFTGNVTITLNADGTGTLVERHPSQTFTYTVTFTRSGSGFTFVTNDVTTDFGGGNVFRSNLDGSFPTTNSGTGSERFTRFTGVICSDAFSEVYTR